MPLRLKSLELHGYKTFAARTVFEFASGITAIVGPNGSGKSNIADSLRWVLGEQSYLLLRGKKTEDMIFSGSEHRPRMSMASAEILFDNSANWLPVDFSEVSMARRAYRDGHNDYLLNGQSVRLRDMNELLAASGLSERTYTILGQGLVDASLALKADERRRLFEEAAGVGLYRVRREEALKRLEETQHNLERVQDIMAELEPRIRSLERQAKRAIEYSRVQNDLRVLLLDWYGYHWNHAQIELNETRALMRVQEAHSNEARAVHAKTQAEYARFRERLSGMRAQLNVWHRQSSELHSQRESVSRDLAVLEERRRALVASQDALQSELERSINEEKLAQAHFSEIDQETAGLQSEFDEARSQLRRAQESLQTRQTERASADQNLQIARETIASIHAQRAETQARLDELAVRLESQKQKRDAIQLTIRSAEAGTSKAEQVHDATRAQRVQAAEAVQRTIADVENRRREVERLENERRAKLEERFARQASYSRAQAQLDILTQAEQSLAGYAEGARFLLDAARRSRLNARGALSAALDVPAELETAIASALGDTLDAVLLEADQIEEALQLLESDEAGRAALLPLNGAVKHSLNQPNDSDCLGIASSLVNAPDDLRAAVHLLLGNTLIVRDRSAARRLLDQIPAHARIVTLRGEVFRGDGLIVAGKSATASTLSRPRQKRELIEVLSDLTTRLEALNASITRLSEDLTVAQSQLGTGEEELRQAHADFDRAQSAEHEAEADVETARRQWDWQKSQLDELQKEIAEAELDRERLSALASENEAKVAQAQESIRLLSSQLNELNLDEAQEQVAYWNTRLAVIQQSVNGLQLRKSESRQIVDRFLSQQQEVQAKLGETDHQLKELDEEKTILREREGVMHKQAEELRVQIEPAEKDLETAEQEEMHLQGVETSAQQNHASAERTLGQIQLDLVRREEGLDNLRQKIVDDFGLVSFEYAANIEGPVPLPFEGLVEQLPVVTELPPDLEQHMTQQRAQLRRMGAINPDAKKEYDTESERYSFMSTQVQDLHQAEEDLRQVISELDELTRKEFERTFEAVDKQFRAIFTRLFGGGSAHLSLTDPNDLVNTGIEIEARLPGRREQGLSLLSGGERSLTAIALVFALLKVSPTPVCVMDEVDAMLDEANVGRFRDLLVDLSKDTQFIVITHNRNTVQAADVIYGVTMGRDSASQIISLKLDEVSEEMLGTSRT
ncbi:MAG TPA: chromosome segregation protein SMC [Anaerolineales bacterium]|nr:chromosome segregation protein SMC [Anaerolineales bacterium]